MFDDATDAVRAELQKTFDQLEKKILHDYNAHVLGTIERAYKNLIRGTKVFASLKKTRDQLRRMLAEADGRFAMVIPADIQMEDGIDDGRSDKVPHGSASEGLASMVGAAGVSGTHQGAPADALLATQASG